MTILASFALVASALFGSGAPDAYTLSGGIGDIPAASQIATMDAYTLSGGIGDIPA